MCSCAAKPMMGRISSSAGTTSATVFGTALRSASRWNSVLVASWRSGRRWRRRSTPSAGPASTGHFGTLRTKALALPIYDPALPEKSRSCAACCSAVPRSLNASDWPNRFSSGLWELKPGIEQTLRDLSIRGDIIKTMHRAMTGAGREPDVSGFALHGDDIADPVLGRLVARGLPPSSLGWRSADGACVRRRPRRWRRPSP